jgi:hypothetical protein
MHGDGTVATCYYFFLISAIFCSPLILSRVLPKLIKNQARGRMRDFVVSKNGDLVVEYQSTSVTVDFVNGGRTIEISIQ